MTILGLSHRRAIIVGAGQAGLAVASALRTAGLAPQRDFAIIDANPRGERSWASRADSMQLLTDAQHSAIGGVPLPSDPARRPYPPEMERYLTAVEASIGVATMWGIRATGVEHRGTGSTLLLRTAEGAVQTRNVVCATGFASRPSLPAWASGLIVPGVILHSADYRLSRQIPQGDVLIIGGGDSGTQVAGELAHSHVVTLSTRSRHRHGGRTALPPRGTVRSSWFRRQSPTPASDERLDKLLRSGVTFAPGSIGVDGQDVLFADGTRVKPQSVIFATGYLPGDQWLPQSVRDGAHRRLRRGMTTMPGLFVAGHPRHGRHGSDTFIGAQRDASAIVRRIMNRP